MASSSRKERVVIDISNEDFGTLCICALRYCHGRRTYMPSLVQEIVTAHFKDLDNRALTVISDDERFQKDMEMWGDNCDKMDWQKFYRSLEQFRVGLEQAESKYQCKRCRHQKVPKSDFPCTFCDEGDRFEPQTDCAWQRGE